MNSAAAILTYAKAHNISLVAENELLKINAPETALTDDFLSSAKQYKDEIIKSLSERWNPELTSDGYVWCLDCQHFNGVNCNHTDNPFHTVEKQPLAPRRCQWFADINNEITSKESG